MKSQIRVEYDFDNAEPVIRVTIEHDSDDMRDRMLHYFFELCGEQTKLGLVYEKSPEHHAGTTKSVIKLFPLGSKTEKQAYPLTFDIVASIPTVPI